MKRNKIKLRFNLINANDDPEKLVTPAVVFLKKKDLNITIYWLALGWWQYALSLSIIKISTP